MPVQVSEQFWLGIERTEFCWNWIGSLDSHGIPVIRVYQPKDKQFYARRVSLLLAERTISNSEHVLPLACRNKLCVNPDHLVSGDEARFWAKVQKLSTNDACWVWIASQDKDMYGKFRLFEKGKKIDIRAHVYSWQLFSGHPVPKGLQVCHKCDHPYCVNPTHLFLGTTQDNTKDRDQKGRQARGETSGNAILTEMQVKEIRELYKVGYTIAQLSSLYGRGRSTISGIVHYLSWKHAA